MHGTCIISAVLPSVSILFDKLMLNGWCRIDICSFYRLTAHAAHFPCRRSQGVGAYLAYVNLVKRILVSRILLQY